MTAHRYWRATGFEAYGLAGLDITEFQLIADTTRVDASATLTSNIAPATGSIANLKDDDTSTGATWGAIDMKTLVLSWDFGSGGDQDVTDIRIGSAGSAIVFPVVVNLQWSDDGIAWTDRYSTPFVGIKWPGARTKTASAVRTIRGKLRFDKSWVDQSIVGQTVYSTGASIFHGVVNGYRLQIAPGSATDIRVRFATMPSMADVDITAVVNLQGEPSVVFRTSFWGNANDTYGYVAGVGAGNVYIGKGSNSSTPAYTAIASVAHGLGSSTDVTLRVTMTGSAYKVYLNGVLKLSGTDTTHTGPGEIGVRSYNAVSFFNSLQVSEPEETHSLIILDTAYMRMSRPVVAPSAMSIAFAYGVVRVPQAAVRGRKDYLTGVLGQGIGRVKGTTKDKGTPNVPVSERVRLYREQDGLLIREMWSAPGTGAYSFDYVDEYQTYTVISYDHDKNFRAVVADGLTLANGGVELIA